MQTLRHRSDAILTGIGTVLADDCRLTDRSGLERSRPLLRIVLDSQLRLPSESRLATSCHSDVLVVTTSAASPERRKRLESMGVRVEVLERTDGRASLQGVVELLAREKYLSLMIEAGSRVNWSALESGVADKIYFYYAPKILGGTQSLPVAGGAGRRRRKDAIRFPGREAAFDRQGRIRRRSLGGARRLMFTGIVEELGTVVAAGTKLEVRCSTVLSDLSIGASIAVNGVCLTAVAVTGEGFAADLAPETLSRSNLGDLVAGSRVNLERPVTPSTRLSGHIVQGHVDATGEVVALDALGDGNWWLKVRVPKSLDRYLVEKGSVTLDGISLTIAALDRRCDQRYDHSAHVREHDHRPSSRGDACERRSGRAGEARREAAGARVASWISAAGISAIAQKARDTRHRLHCWWRPYKNSSPDGRWIWPAVPDATRCGSRTTVGR